MKGLETGLRILGCELRKVKARLKAAEEEIEALENAEPRWLLIPQIGFPY